MRLFNGILAAVMLLGVVAGCGKTEPDLTQKKAPKLIKKVVSLSPSTTEIMSEGAAGLLAGRTQSCNYPKGITNVPIVAGVKPDYEKIAQMKPDLIVYDANLYNESDLAKMKEMGIELFAIDANSLKDFADELYRLGALVGGEIYLSNYADRISTAESISKATPITPKPTVALLLPGSGSEHLIAGLDSFQADILRAAGAQPVCPAGTKFVPVNPESLIQLNPDVILVGGNATSVLSDARLKPLKAMQTKHIYEVDPDVMTRRGIRVDLAIRKTNIALKELYK